MTFKQLEYVFAIAKCGSLSQAAANLYISQPALSEAVQNLEKELGFSLLVRHHAGVTLTPEGESFLKDAQVIVEKMEEIERRYTLPLEKPARFSISSTHFYFVQSAFAQFSREVEGPFSLRLLDSPKLDVLSEVARGVSELGFLSYSEENRRYILQKINSQNLEAETIRVLQPCAFLSARHPLASRRRLTIDDPKPYPCVTYYQSPTIPRYFEEELYQLPEWGQEFIAQDNGAITFLLQGTECFSIGCGSAPPTIQALGITSVPVVDISPATLVWIKRRNQQLSSLAERFLALARREFFSNFSESFRQG